jgi:DNA-binding SARP family transcriptional activator
VALPGKKSQALLAYLVVKPGTAHPRDKLAALLWPDVPDHQARQSLRQALFSMRRAIPGLSHALRVDDSAVALAPGAVDVDTEAFARLVAEATPASLEEAVQLYRGDFLAGIGGGDTPFEEWLIGERERLRELALEGLARLLTAQMKVDGSPGAVATALRLVALDPLQESAHRTLMRLYDRDGRRDAALRQYQACVDVLARDLGVEPEAETRSLYQAIVQRRTEAPVADDRAAEPSARTPAAAPTTTAPMVGRDAERARLATALDAAFAGAGRTVAILGEAGIGKSRLVRAVVEDALRRRGRVVLGQGWQAEQTLPFGPWLDAFRAAHVARDEAVRGAIDPFWRAQLARLLPELGGDSSARSGRPEEPIRLFEAVAV